MSKNLILIIALVVLSYLNNLIFLGDSDVNKKINEAVETRIEKLLENFGDTATNDDK